MSRHLYIGFEYIIDTTNNVNDIKLYMNNISMYMNVQVNVLGL